MKEYDVVLCDDDAQEVPVGTLGTIVYVHDLSRRIFEVEFVDADGMSIGVFTMDGRNLKFVGNVDR